MRIIEPVIVRPLLAEWETEKTAIAAALERAEAARSEAARTRQRRQSDGLLRAFLERLRRFTTLDPACGSGNFLYLALQALKDIEHRVQLEAEAMGLQRAFPAVGPANVRGIEINAYAAELARVSVWIGEIQWMRRNGFRESRDPVLKPLETVECRDAILAPDGTEPDWPEADVVIGNPPFLGDRVMRGSLGHEYTEILRRTYRGFGSRLRRSRLLLVREGRGAGGFGSNRPRRTGRHQLHPGREQPSRARSDRRRLHHIRRVVG